MNYQKLGSGLPIEEAMSPSHKGHHAELGRNVQATIGQHLRAIMTTWSNKGFRTVSPNS